MLLRISRAFGATNQYTRIVFNRRQTCQYRNMSTITAGEIALPPVNRDMNVLDRSFFQRTVQTSALSIHDPRLIQAARAALSASCDLLSATTIKPIVEDEATPGSKCILLQPRVQSSDPSTWDEKWKYLVDEGKARIRPYELTLRYDDWTMSEILDAILPELSNEDEQNPSGFAQVGHVAHLNLREQFLPYKHLIAQVLLDKNHTAKTVINKLHDVGKESVFRTFPYEVLAGPDDLNVIVHHAGCEFRFNFGEVYWNTRNGHEHERLISTFKPGEVICDVMAGVGPFAVPAAKKGVWVRANDLNPACYKSMSAAIVANKVSEYALASNLDGATFIKSASQQLLNRPRTFDKKPKIKVSRDATKEDQKKTATKIKALTVTLKEPRTFDHFVMNLPASAIEFLYAFKGIYHGHEGLFATPSGRRLPMVHVYVFQARKDTEDEERVELLQRLSSQLGYKLDSKLDEVMLHRARLVAPNKLFYCASFRLPAAVAFAEPPTDMNEGVEANAATPDADSNFRPWAATD